MSKNILNDAIPFKVDFSLDTVISVDELDSKHDAMGLKSFNEGIETVAAKDKHGKVIGTNVKWDASHDNGIKDELYVGSIKVPKLNYTNDTINLYSILKRVNMTKGKRDPDGNPLIYAMKQEKNYWFASAEDRLAVKNAIEKVIEEFIAKYFQAISSNSATLVVIPSQSSSHGASLNSQFSSLFTGIAKKMSKKIVTYDHALVKMTTEDFEYHVMDDQTSALNQWLNSLSEERADSLRSALYADLDTMDKKHNGLFSYHFVSDPETRNHISSVMKTAQDEFYYDYCKNINDEHVLVLDDTVSRGTSICDACNALCSSYHPKTLTALTLFSPRCN